MLRRSGSAEEKDTLSLRSQWMVTGYPSIQVIRLPFFDVRGTLDSGRRTGRSLPVALAYASVRRGRKVRTPQGSVPDNVRDAGFKARGRPVPQKRYRLGYPSSSRSRASLETQDPSWPGLPGTLAVADFQRRGKGEMVRQERTARPVKAGAG